MPRVTTAPISRRDQVIIHATTGALTDKTIAKVTGSTLADVRRWRRQANISLLARRRLVQPIYRDNYRRMLVALAPVLNRAIRVHGYGIRNRRVRACIQIANAPRRSSSALSISRR